jgi:hypothetical protein
VMATVVHSQKQQSNNNRWYCGRPGMVTMTARFLNANYDYKSGSLSYMQRLCALRILQSDLRRRTTTATGGRSGARFSVVGAKSSPEEKTTSRGSLTYAARGCELRMLQSDLRRRR